MAIREIEVITNNVPRLLLDYDQLPENVAKDEFDYIEDESGSFFKYKGNYYDLGDMMVIDHNRECLPDAFKGWDAYIGDSYFSGIVVKLVHGDPDYIIVGMYVA